MTTYARSLSQITPSEICYECGQCAVENVQIAHEQLTQLVELDVIEQVVEYKNCSFYEDQYHNTLSNTCVSHICENALIKVIYSSSFCEQTKT